MSGGDVLFEGLLARLPALAGRWAGGDMDDACYAALYFLHGQIAYCGRRYASRRDRNDARPDAAVWLSELERAGGDDRRGCLLRYLEHYQFFGVIPNVPAALCAWLRGEWPLYACGHIPSAREVLHAQARGRRPVTLIGDYPRLCQPVLEKPNAWMFMTHDLEHAYKFFHDEESSQGQRRFFQRIERALYAGLFECPLRDAVFAAKFDYLISDMNTHSHHSLHYLRAILIEFYLRREQRPLHAALSPASQYALDHVIMAVESDVALTKGA